MEKVYTLEQYEALKPQEQMKLDEYYAEFYDLAGNGFWCFCARSLYSEGKDAHLAVEKWVKTVHPMAEEIRVTYL